MLVCPDLSILKYITIRAGQQVTNGPIAVAPSRDRQLVVRQEREQCVELYPIYCTVYRWLSLH